MKIINLFLVAALSAIFILASVFNPRHAYAEQIIKDPSFELSAANGTFPNSGYWKPSWYGSTAGAICTTKAAKVGTRGLWAYTAAVPGLTWTGTYQDFAAVPGQVVQAGAWMRTPPRSLGGTWASGSKACIRIEFLNSSGARITFKESSAIRTANSVWRYYSFATIPAPAGTVKVRFRCYVEKPNNGIRVKSVANFDDCSLSLGPLPDATPPTGTMKINGDAPYTNNAAVILSLYAQDNTGGSGIDKMQFSNDGTTWSAAEAFAFTRSWAMSSGDASKTVYAKFSDKAGNWSTAYSDSITLDTTAPAVSLTMPSNNEQVKGVVAIEATASDTGSGMREVSFSIDGIVKSIDTALPYTYSWDTRSYSAGSHAIMVTGRDNLGNARSVQISVIVTNDMFSKVWTDGFKLMVQKRNAGGGLDPAGVYIVKGAVWSPAGKGTPGPELNQEDMRRQLAVWCDTDIPLIKQMNANTVRTYMDFGLSDDYAAKNWQYVLDKCYQNGIMVIVTVDRCIVDMNRVRDVVTKYKNHPAILMWVIGNEWNINNFYGAFPDLISGARAVESAAQLIKSIDQNHPVASCLGEPNHPAFSDIKNIIINTCPSVDVWGFNVFRGRTFTNLFDQWRDIAVSSIPKPMLLTEFGCDDYDINKNAEDQDGQRTREYYQWDHISKNLTSKGADKVCSGGCVFEFTDEWWKAGNPYGHDTGGWITQNSPDGHASEEWWGLCDIDRNPRKSYQLFKEYFGGVIPVPPPPGTEEDYNVVRFSTQPDTITTNLQNYFIADEFPGATEATINGEVIQLDGYNGFTKDIVLGAGANILTLKVTPQGEAEKTFTKTVIYDPNYSTAQKRLLYADSIVIDLDAGAVLGRLPVTAVAITHNSKFVIEPGGQIYSTGTNAFTGKAIDIGSSGYPVFSNDDTVIYAHTIARNFDTGALITDKLPVDVSSDLCKISNNGYLFYVARNIVKKIDPVTFNVVKEIPFTLSGALFGGSGISNDGSLALATSFGWGSGSINIIDVVTGEVASLSGLSDYMGGVAPSYDGNKIFVGGGGNSWYGAGGIYVIDKASKSLNSFYHQYGAGNPAVSADNVFATSAYAENAGRVQGSKYHRGIEVLEYDSSTAQLKYLKSFFLMGQGGSRMLYKKGY